MRLLLCFVLAVSLVAPVRAAINPAEYTRRAPEQARAALQASIVVKFHGRPRMHEVFDPWHYLLRVRLKELAHGRWQPVLPIGELQRDGCGMPASPESGQASPQSA